MYEYEYIKGNKFQSPEHMLSATEIARLYGIYRETGKVNGEKYAPNSLVVSVILKDYVVTKNLNISEIYYPHSHGCLRVYSKILYEPAMEDLIYKFNLEQNQNKELYYKMISEQKTYKYFYIKPNKVLSFNTRKKG